MNFKVARRTRSGEAKISIRENKTAFFNAAFVTEHKLDNKNANFVRIGYDENEKLIAFEILDSSAERNKAYAGQISKFSFLKNRRAGNVTLSHLLINFKIDIKGISGVYNGDAMKVFENGIEGFSQNFTVVVDIEKRQRK